MKKGFNLIELLIVITILGLICVMGSWYLTQGIKKEALLEDKQGAISLLQEARGRSLSSEGASKFGIHIEEFRLVLFKGDVYSAGSVDNIAYEFNSKVHSPNHSLQGGGDDIIFSRLTGEVLNYGTLVLSLKNNSLSSTTITVSGTGVIE